MPNWEPEKLGERTWLLPTGVNAGLWEASEGAVLIDSGGDKESGRPASRKSWQSFAGCSPSS
jgi:hypothetical protein